MNSRKSQQQLNASTREQWVCFAGHRKQVTHLMAGVAQGLSDASVAVLGAGNGNDIDYAAIAGHFQSIHLFDFDLQSMDHLRATQLAQLPAQRVFVEPEIDLSGVSDQLDSFSPTAADSQVVELIDVARRNAAPLRGRQFDVVVSVCMLTQLLNMVVENLGDDAKYKNEMMIALRDGHLRLMSRLLKSGGKGLLVTDFVSSDTLASLSKANTDQQVLDLARQAIDQRNFFTGTNPWAIKDSLSTMLVEVPSSPWSIKPPWRWQIGDDRFYLVTAIEFSKQF